MIGEAWSNDSLRISEIEEISRRNTGIFADT